MREIQEPFQHSPAFQTMDRNELDDLSALVAIANGDQVEPPAAAAQGASLVNAVNPDPAEHVEVQLLQDLIALQEPRTSYERRSDDLMAHARLAKERKRSQRQLAAATDAKKIATDAIALVAHQFPLVARSLGMTRRRLTDPTAQALIHLKLACSPKFKGAYARNYAQSQIRSTRLVAGCLLDQQQTYAEEVLDIAPGAGQAHPLAPRVIRRFVAYSAQWDETAQMLSPTRSRLLPAQAKVSKAQTSAQIMVFSGALQLTKLMRSTLGCDSMERTVQPWHSLSLRLDAQDADHLIEAVLRCMPLALMDAEVMEQVGTRNEGVLLQFGTDRASANLSAGKWFATLLHQKYIALPLYLHLEPCALHGVALVKQRCSWLKSIMTALRSFTRWLRVGKNLQGLSEHLTALIRGGVVVRRAERPQEARERAKKIVELLYGDLETSTFLWRTCKKTNAKVKSVLLLDLESLIDSLDFDANATKFTFWNYVSVDSEDHKVLGKAVGSAAIETAEQAGDRIATPVLGFLTGRAWVDAVESRWTNFFASLRRFTIGIAANNVLPIALDELRKSMKVTDDLEDALAKLVAADSSDVASKNKLRLIRFTKVLCDPSLAWQLGIMATTLAPIESLQYAIMGHDRVSATLGELVHPHKSPIAKTASRLLELSLNFSADGSWLLASLLGADLNDQGVRMAARKALLQLSAGLAEVFEFRLATGIYRLLWLTFSDVTDAAKRTVACDFFAESRARECDSSMCRHLRLHYPSVEELLGKGPAFLKAFEESVQLTIDFSERTHGQMRHDLGSAGPGYGFGAAAERTLCRQFAVDHISRGGLDPAKITFGDILAYSVLGDLEPASKRRNVGGNPWMEFHAVRFRTFKALVAPDRPLTQSEHAEIEQTIKSEWQTVRNDEDQYACWQARFRAGRGGSSLGSAQGAGQIARCEEGPAFSGLWQKSQDPKHLLPPSAIVDFSAAAKTSPSKKLGVGKQAAAEQADRLHIREPVARSHGIDECCRLFDCQASKKNICRVHGCWRDGAKSLDEVCSLLSAWVQQLPTDTKDSASELVWLEASEPEKAEATVVVALLVKQFLSPKMQMFADCGLELQGRSPLRTFVPPPFPFTVTIMDRASRLAGPGGFGDDVRCIACSSSDELAFFLKQHGRQWRLFPLRYEMCEGPSLLRMRVLGRGNVFEKPVRARTGKPSVALPSVFDLGDPLEFGRSQAAGTSSGAPAGDGRGGGGGGEGGEESEDEEEDLRPAADAFDDGQLSEEAEGSYATVSPVAIAFAAACAVAPVKPCGHIYCHHSL